jgi:hypothetical protein
MSKLFLLGLLVGIFPIFTGCVLLQANSVGKCDTYTDPLNINSGTTHGCFIGAISFLFVGITASVVSTCYIYHKDHNEEVQLNG